MDDETAKQLEQFEIAKENKSGEELWSARELMPMLGYVTWQNFSGVISRAQDACEKSGFTISDHFRKATKMIEIGHNTVRPVVDFKLTRYACYLIAQNGSSNIPQIALAQTYFAIQTRKQEMGEQRQAEFDRLSARHKLAETEKEFASELMKREVDGVGIAQIKSRGDKKLFGGKTTNDMKRQLGVPPKRPLADFLPTVTLKAKDLAAEITTFNTQKNNLHGVNPIALEHEQNSVQVRGVLNRRGIFPESLPPSDDVKKLERRIKKQMPGKGQASDQRDSQVQ